MSAIAVRLRVSGYRRSIQGLHSGLKGIIHVRKIVPFCLFAMLLGVAACSSDHSGVTPPPAGIEVSGAVVDGPVAGATVSAYAVSSAGVVGTTALATATTSATGTYSLTLPAGTTGSVLLTSAGGTFIDDASGKTLTAPPLSVLIPSVTGTAPVTAQLTPVTTIAAQVALATSSATNSVGSVATAINTAIGTALGGQSNIVATPLVNVSTAACAGSATQASVDASLLLAGISQLAATNNVSTSDLIQALVVDISSDNVFDGTANGVLLTVPLSGGTVKLCTIEGNCAGATPTGLAQQLGAAITAFQKSAANACGAAESASQQQTLANAPPGPLPITSNYKYTYTLASTITGDSGSSPVVADMLIGLTCKDDGGGTTTSSPFQGVKQVGANGAFTVLAGANGESTVDGYTVGINGANDCGSNTWMLKLTIPTDLSCNVSGATSGLFSSTDGGNTNVAISPPTVTCSPLYFIGGTVTGLTTGSLTLQDNGGDNLNVQGSAPNFTFATGLASGATYVVTVQTQPTGFTCAVSPTTPQTVASSNVTSVAVTCSPTPVGTGGGTPSVAGVYVIDSTFTLFEFNPQGGLVASTKLPGASSDIGYLNGGGITVDANNVYVTLGTSSASPLGPMVAAFNRNTLQPVTLASGAFTNLSVPRELVFDPENSQFYVANGGTTVSVYNAAGTYLSTFNQFGPGIYGPSGIAYDPTDNVVWVANYTGGGGATNPTYGIAEFNPNDALVANFPTANSIPPTPFAPPVNTGAELPYTISYCGNALAVGFISDSSGTGTSQVAGYTTSGALLGAPFSGALTNLHATACATGGNVYVAADNGLFEYNNTTGASVALPAGGFAGLTPPIYGVGVGAATAGLNGPEGLVYANGALYVANSGNNQVLVYAIQTSGTGAVSGMTLSGTITADLNDPVRLALDASGHLFVANKGNNTVSVYNTSAGYSEISAAGSGPLISSGSLNAPLGVAVDSLGNVYVANNGGNSISIFKPVTSGNVSAGYTEASFSPLTADSAGNGFAAPGALIDADIGGQNYLLVGTGSNTAADHVLGYAAPFTGAPAPQFNLSSATCATAPSGPTGFAFFLSQSDPLTSQIYVTSYYNNEAVEYVASQVIGSSASCPSPITTGTQAQISSPEGIAVDSAGANVFVSNAGSNTITVYPAGATLNSAPIFTLHN
jgi:DNA-binding beta-propeller fold protein YncE